MGQQLSAWFNAMRLRTLPLAVASTFTGAFLAMTEMALDAFVLVLTATTTILLQINSNLANDYGDFSHGTDNEQRVGPERAMQSGRISEWQMRRAIVLTSALSLLSGSALLYVAPLSLTFRIVLFVLGLLAIVASIRYTAGSRPYGYRGLGDLSVMAFFGILGVAGAYVCQTGTLEWEILLPAISVGAFSAGVLNINNVRDLESDKGAGKITLAVKLGPVRARIYHVLLILAGMTLFTLYAVLKFAWGWNWLYLMAYPLFIINAVKVYNTSDPAVLDPMLKQLALGTFLFSLLLGIGLILG